MTIAHVEVLVEEPSMEAFLRMLLPRLLGSLSFEIYPFQCKGDLLAKLPSRLRGYHSWLPPDWRIVVVMDRDGDSCLKLKKRMDKMASDAGLVAKSLARGRSYSVVNRLAIEELEAWWFGDWEAVRNAYPRVPETIPEQAAYRNPDSIRGGTWEAFERVLQRAGYFKNGLRKIEVARQVAKTLDPDRNSSSSFRAFRDVLLEMAACE